MIGRRSLAVIVLATVLRSAHGGFSAARSVEVDAGADWCAALDALEPGAELALRPGDHPGPCTIRRGGTAAAPVVVRAADPARPPRIVYLGRETNVLNVRAGHVVVRGLRFGPTLPGVDAVRIHQGDGVTVEGCHFDGVGGIAVVANSRSLRGLTVRGNRVVASRATAMYLGCHDGLGCAVTGLLVEGNFIAGVTSDAVGYGIQVKLNSAGIVRDNVVVDTKGPGIMVYGAHDPALATLVERNFVSAARTSSGIVVGGGPAIVRNNIVTGSAEAGIGLENYGNRGLLRGVVVVHNTVHGNAQGGIVAFAGGALEVTVVNNAAHAPPGTPAVPLGRAGVRSLGNVDCSAVPCFVDPAGRDFSPLAVRAGLPLPDPWMPTDDYLGRPRATPPMAGALEAVAGPVPLEPKLAAR